MKFNIEIDCTPEEARSFFGLPDVKPMQAAVMQKVEKQMLDALASMSPEALLKTWVPERPRVRHGRPARCRNSWPTC